MQQLNSLLSKIPTIQRPTRAVSFKEKLMWTIGILAVYFLLTNIQLFGLSPESSDMFEAYRTFFAGASGSILLLGIGPIVTASIILQLLVGANVINLDLSNPLHQEFFQNLQKALIIVMAVLEAIPQIVSGFIQPDVALANSLGIDSSMMLFGIFIQIVIGGLMIMYMDEIVSRWGIGSGVGLFIVAGISEQLINGIINWRPDETGIPVGLIPKWIYIFQSGALDLATMDGISYMLISGGVLGLISTIAIFMFVVYAESTRIEIPLSYSGVKGARGKFPVKLIYASVLPMILVRALQANIQMICMLLDSHGIHIFGQYVNGTTPVSGIAYYLSPINSPYQWIPTMVRDSFANYGVMGPETWQIGLHVLMDAIFLIVGGIIFAKFWVQTTGMDSHSTANKIYNSGLQVPGFRRNIGSIEKITDRYIPRVTVLGGAIIGGLTLVASLLGTIGSVGGTGLLLTISIVYRLYEEIGTEAMKDMHPILRNFLGD